MNITYGSVCSGIEAATVAWHPLGWQPAWFAEIESFPASVLHHHYSSGRPLHMPDPQEDGLKDKVRLARRAAIRAVSSLPCKTTGPRNLGDMTKIAAMVRAGAVAAPDVLVGGTPCQAFSIAGLRASLDDARGQLTLSFVDLANAIDTVRHVRGEQPATIVWENVPGVLSTPDNAFGCFLGALAGEDVPLVAPGGKWSNAGCVYGPQRTVAWRVLDAQYFGVAQRRRRVFVVASARKGFDPTEVLFEQEGVRRDSAPSREAPENATGTIAGGARSRGGYSHDDIPLTAGTIRASDGGSNVDQAMNGHLVQAFGGNNTSGPINVSTACRAHPSPHLDFESETFLDQERFAPNVAAPVQRSVERPRGDGLDTLIAGTLQANGKAAGSATQQDAEAGMLITVHAPIAFSSKDYGGDAMVDCSPTLRAGNHAGSHANAGSPPAIAFQCRGSNIDLGQEVTGTLTNNCDRASGGAPCIAFDSRQDCVSSSEVFGTLGSSSPQAQAVCFAENSRGELRLEGGDGQRTGALSTGGGKPGQGLPVVCITGEVTHTLKAEGFDASEDGTGRGQPIVAATLDAAIGRSRGAGTPVGMLANAGLAVRRLTPRECERLQAFPDDHTLIPYGRVVKMEKLEADWIKYLLRGGVMTLDQVCQAAADGPRYKALGNSMCTRNMAWIGRRIELVLSRQLAVAA